VRNREADWADDRVVRSGKYDALDVESAKMQFAVDHGDESGFVEVDFSSARIRQLQTDSDDS